MQSNQDLACAELFESMLDAVGNVGRYAHLSLHAHIGRCRLLRDLLQQLYAPFLILSHIRVIVYHVDGYESAVQLLVSHEDGQVDQLWCILRVFHRNQHALVVGLCVGLTRHVLIANDDLLCCRLGDKCRDDTREQYHNDHTVQHIVADEVLSRCHFRLHANHDDGDGTGGMGRCQTEHHVSRR